MQNPNPNDRWFVDVGNQDIRGPTTTMAIVDALVAGTLKVNHRVSRDRVNWKAICNEEYFETFISKLLNEMSHSVARFAPPERPEAPKQGHDEEASGFYNVKDLSAGISQQLVEAQKMTEISAGANALRKVLVAISIQKKTVVVVQSKPSEEFHPDDESEYIFDEKKSKPWKWKEHPRIMTAIASTVFLFMAQVGYRAYQINKQKQIALLNAKLAKEAVEAKALGDYDKALTLFHQIKGDGNMDARTLLEMAEIDVKRNNFTEGTVLCRKALSLSRDPKEKALGYSLLGFMEMKNRNWDSAATQFQSSLNEDPDYYASLHNLGIIYLNKNSFEVAETLLLKALTLDSSRREVPTILALSEAALGVEAENNSGGGTQDPTQPSKRLQRVDAMLEEAAKTSRDFRAEILAARIRIAVTENKIPMAEDLIRKFIDLNPTALKDKDYHYELNYDRASWDHIYSWCLETYSKQHTDAYLNAFIAGCLYQARGAKQALPYSRYAFQTLPHDSLIQGLYTYLLYVSGSQNDAKDILKKGGELSKLSLLTQARLCEAKHDKACASTYWGKLYLLDPGDPSAVVGMARSEIEKGDKKMAQKILKEGLTRSPASKEIESTIKDFEKTSKGMQHKM